MQHFRWVVTVAAIVTCSAVITSQTPSGHALFEQALAKERVEGNLPEAIKLYERVVAEFASDRALAARALVQLGLCYEKLGRDDAVRTYERLVRDFADQADAAAQARTRLAVLKRAPAATSAVMTVQPLADVGKDGEVLTVSPDGTRAIVMDYSTGQNIALMDLSKKQTRPLTDFDWRAGYAYYAVWSPDGRRVAYWYSSMRGDVSEIRIATLDGRSTVVNLTGAAVTFVQPVGWTPDGTTLLAIVARSDRTRALGTLPATGGQFTPLRSFGWSYDGRAEPPRLSPDGRSVAIVEGETGVRDVHVVSLDGRGAYNITDHPGDDIAPIWSPDGRYLAFKSSRNGSVALWTIEVKDGKPVGPPLKLQDGMQSARLIDWTARGIFYDQQRSTWDLYTVPMDPVDGHPVGPPRQIPYSRTGRNVSPVWSPDGGRLAFVSSSPAEPSRRYVVVMTGTSGTVDEFLIPSTRYEYPNSPLDLRWFGDGRGLGFTSLDSRGAPAVFRLQLATGQWDTTPLSNVSQAWRTRIEWNRDGSAFYFSRDGFSSDGTAGGIFEHPVKGETERRVYSPPPDLMNIRSLEFSPDRKWLAFHQRTASAGKGVASQYRVLDVGTGDSHTLLEHVLTFNSNGPAPRPIGWTPWGDLLVDPRSRTGGATSDVLAYTVNGGTPRPIAIPTFAPGAPGDEERELVAKWSPDGRSMVLGRVSRGGETFVIENPLAAVRTATASR